jgi:hypothetical protein
MANSVWVKFVIDNEDDGYDAFRVKTTLETNIVDDMRKAMVDKMPESIEFSRRKTPFAQI